MALFQCTVCSKPFKRKDSWKRHIQIHDASRPPLRSRKKACNACFRSKLKCGGERPLCTSCVQRGIACLYEVRLREHHNSTSETTALAPTVTQQFTPPSLSDQTETATFATSLQSPFPTPAAYPIPISPDGSGAYFTGEFDWNLDWVFDGVPQDSMTYVQAATLGGRYLVQATPVPTDQMICHPENWGPRESRRTPPTSSRIHRDPSSRALTEDPWPFHWHATPSQAIVLPQLSSDDTRLIRPRHFSTRNVQNSTRNELRRALCVPLEKGLWNPVSVDGFPSIDTLDHCIDLYFKHFDWILPIVHRPTFDPAQYPLVTLVIICLGANFSDFHGARAFSNALSELIRRLLLFIAESDPQAARTEWFLTVQILQMGQGYGSGSRQLFDISESHRSSLVHRSRCMGLFRKRNPIVPKDDSLQSRWNAWIEDERFRRLGWAIYGADCATTYLYNRGPYVSVGEIDMDMQSSTEYWEAESPQSWAALHPWTEAAPKSLTFKHVVQRFLTHEGDLQAASTNEEHHRLPIILTLMRMIWSLKEHGDNPLSELMLDKSFQDGQRERLLGALDHMADFGAVTCPLHSWKSRLGLVHRLRTINMAHLISAGNLMDWMYATVRKGRNAVEAKTHISRWARCHPQRAREVTFRSAQILALIRTYPYNLATEPFDLFHAGVALSLLAPNLQQRDGSSPARQVIRLDYLGGDKEPEMVAIRAWTQYGHCAHLQLSGILDLSVATGPREVLEHTAELLRRMRIWGIAQNFLKVIEAFMQD